MSAEGSLGRQWTVQHHGEHPFGGEWSSVQDESGQDVGHARYRPDGGWRDHRGNPLTEVSYIHVDPEHRGQGAANAVYGAVRERTGNAILHVRDEMSPEAKRAVARASAEDPDGHKVMTWVNHERRIQKYPARRLG